MSESDTPSIFDQPQPPLGNGDRVSQTPIPKRPDEAGGDDSTNIAPEQEFYIPVHGFVWLTQEEVSIVDHPAFQRLGNVYQLGQSRLIYRGATHRRFEHAIGTLCVANEIVLSVRRNHHRLLYRNPDKDIPPPPTVEEHAFIRLAALVHDIGHIPAGHTLEDELGILDKHDGEKRLNLVLSRTDWPGGDAPPLRALINERFSKWTQDTDITPTEALIPIIQDEDPDIDPHEGPIRNSVCRDIIGNTICADLLDYLHRDWYHIGKERHFDRRIFQYMGIRYSENPDKREEIPRFVISLGETPRIRRDAVSETLKLLDSRYRLSESVLYQRTKCAVASMLERAVQELDIKTDLKEDENGSNDHRAEEETSEDVPENKSQHETIVSKLLDVSDEGLLDYLLNDVASDDDDAAKKLLHALKRRDVYTNVLTEFRGDMEWPVFKRVSSYFAGGEDAPANRLQLARQLEYELSLSPGSVTVYCPDTNMNRKVAKVNIEVNNDIMKLNEAEENSRISLSSGHLGDQIERFESLWRIHVFIHSDELTEHSNDVETALSDYISALVFRDSDQMSSVWSSRHEPATRLADAFELPYTDPTSEYKVGDQDYDYGDEYSNEYPTGMRRLDSYFRSE